AALLVKLVNRHDRPSLALRLHRRGWLDVYGMPKQWAPYGITAQPTVTFPQLAAAYRKYAVHLNAANCARDATANEKLFEIAACGRLSINLDSPDVRACYSGGEIVLAESDDALEAAAERALRNPDASLAAGEKARQRTANEHLWEHRLKKALA
ncbi:MAG TPA: glycosyltransferase, partial [Candidatus Methylacidiphilales bacterium]|nr:glycosyltransferase [Candidatus Methylacidiphilales bacterium]